MFTCLFFKDIYCPTFLKRTPSDYVYSKDRLIGFANCVMTNKLKCPFFKQNKAKMHTCSNFVSYCLKAAFPKIDIDIMSQGLLAGKLNSLGISQIIKVTNISQLVPGDILLTIPQTLYNKIDKSKNYDEIFEELLGNTTTFLTKESVVDIEVLLNKYFRFIWNKNPQNRGCCFNHVFLYIGNNEIVGTNFPFKNEDVGNIYRASDVLMFTNRFMDYNSSYKNNSSYKYWLFKCSVPDHLYREQDFNSHIVRV